MNTNDTIEWLEQQACEALSKAGHLEREGSYAFQRGEMARALREHAAGLLTAQNLLAAVTRSVDPGVSTT